MDSVTGQSFDAWEHIVVDDGSDDGTGEEVTKRAAADSRIRYVRRTGERSGANVCRNVGVKDSGAESIVFLDSDDILSSAVSCPPSRSYAAKFGPRLRYVPNRSF
jgi:glycosyltransferase involved in cell wall biosynthesis